MRTVILHYHLFKNAGTSVERLLQHHLPGAWRSREFSTRGGDNSAEVRDWILSHPEALAFSSHTMVGPLPQIEGVRIYPLMLLRDPLARIISAYRFEQAQRADTLGARLAKETDFGGYVRARLAKPGDRQCRNFQCTRLASHSVGPEPAVVRARASLAQFQRLGVVGLVEQFDATMANLATRLPTFFPLPPKPRPRANVGRGPAPQLDEPLRRLLEEANADDLALVAQLRAQRQAA